MQGEPKSVVGASPIPRIPPPRPVPDAQAVRQAALAASWRRDRVVAQRRLAWRWALWRLRRAWPYLLAAAALLGSAAYLWFAAPTQKARAEAPAAADAPLKLHSDHKLHSQEP